jgi:hypothetical protein
VFDLDIGKRRGLYRGTELILTLVQEQNITPVPRYMPAPACKMFLPSIPVTRHGTAVQRRSWLWIACTLAFCTSPGIAQVTQAAQQGSSAQPASVPKLSGTWIAKINSPMGEMEVIYRLDVTGSAVLIAPRSMAAGGSPASMQYWLCVPLELLSSTGVSTTKSCFTGYLH